MFLVMSAGSVGPSGVKNLRAMFESKTSDQSTSPPSRGRSSPNGSVSSVHSRPVSKVRSSFVAVERPGEPGQPIQWGLRKTSDVSSMAEVREEALAQDNETLVTPAVSNTDKLQISTPEGQDLGAILKGSPFETSPVDAPEANGAFGTSTVETSKTDAQPNSNTRSATDKETKPAKTIPTSLVTKPTGSKSKDSPTLTKKSPVLQKKPQDSPTTSTGNGPTFKPRGGVDKIKGVMESAKRAQEERDKADGSSPTVTGNGPTFKPRGGADKIKGVLESAREAEEEREKAQDSPTTTTGGTGPAFKPRGGAAKITGVLESARKAQEERDAAAESPTDTTKKGPTFKPRGGVPKITGVIESARKAQEEREQAEQYEQMDDGPSTGYRKLSPTKTRVPSVATKQTAASRAHAQKKESSSPETVQMKSPVSTRSMRLPSAATAATAASSARKEAAVESDGPKSSATSRRSINPQAPRVANVATKASLAKKSSRASLANGEDRAKSRQSITPRQADEGFLARMTRPTASTTQKAHDKLQVNSPPRSSTRKMSDNTKKPGRKSLNIGATQLPTRHAAAEETDETVLEPVDETDPTALNGDDEGEPGPEVDDGIPPQQAEVLGSAAI